MPTRRKTRVSRVLQIAALLITLPHPCLRAGESWEKKPYAEWTATEAMKVLTDSPWSRIAILQDNPGGSTTASTPIALSNRRRPGEKCPCCGPQGQSGAAGLGQLEAMLPSAPGPDGQVVYFRVIFFSSARVRQALARLAQLDGNTVPPQPPDRLQSTLADYVIALAGPFVGAFQDASLDGLKASTYLRSRKRGGAEFELKRFIPPQELTVGMALFFFSRGGEGKPPFNAADGQAEFATGEGSFKIKASFKIDKMAVNGTLDF